LILKNRKPIHRQISKIFRVRNAHLYD